MGFNFHQFHCQEVSHNRCVILYNENFQFFFFIFRTDTTNFDKESSRNGRYWNAVPIQSDAPSGPDLKGVGES